MSVVSGMEGVSFQWVDHIASLEALQDEWLALAKQTDADIYLHPTWLRVWCNHFGDGRRFRCLLARQYGRLVGVLPFVIDTFWIPVPVRVARLAGIDPHCMVMRLPLEADVLTVVLQRAVKDLIGMHSCDAVSFTPISDLAEHLGVLRQLPQEIAGLVPYDRPEGGHVVFDLPDDFSIWLGALSKKRRSQYQRDRQNLENMYGMQRRIRHPDREAFREFADFHASQWHALGKGGHFLDWAGSLAFYGDLADLQSADGGMLLFESNGRSAPLASQFVLLSGRTAHWRLPARTLDPEAEKFSIGKVGLIEMIEELIRMGVSRIEAGRGDYGYKLSYGGQSVPVNRLLLASKTCAWRLSLLLTWADMIHFLYYRAWFLRLAPQLRQLVGGRFRPLWGYWRKTQL